MKKLILLAVLFSSLALAAQERSYTYIAQRNEWLAGAFRALGLPAGDGPAAFQSGQRPWAGAVYYDSAGVDAGLYIYDGSAWSAVGSGSTIIAGEGLAQSNDSLHLGGTIAAPSYLQNERVVSTNRKIMHWTNGVLPTSGGPSFLPSFPLNVNWSPIQFISSDTVTANDLAVPSAAVPFAGVYASRQIYFADGIIRNQKMFGHNFQLLWNWKDTFSLDTRGGDYNTGFRVENMFRPRGTGRQGIRASHGTGQNNSIYYAAPALLVNTFLDNQAGNYIKVDGHLSGVNSYLVMGTTNPDTVGKYIAYTTGAFIGANSNIGIAYDFAPGSPYVTGTIIDSFYNFFDTARIKHWYQAAKTVIGPSRNTIHPWSSTDQLKVIGNVNITDSLKVSGLAGYWNNIAANYNARSFTDKNYVDSAIAAGGGGGSSLFPLTGTATATGAVIGSLSGNSLFVKQATDTLLHIDPVTFTNKLKGTNGTAYASLTTAGNLAGNDVYAKLEANDGTNPLVSLELDGQDGHIHIIATGDVSSDGNIRPDDDNQHDLGNATISWRDIYNRRSIFKGSTSGSIIFQPPAVAGTNTITLPAATGTVALTSDIVTPTFQQVLDAGSTLTSTETVALSGNQLIFDGTNADVTVNHSLGAIHVSSTALSAASFNSTHSGTGAFFTRSNSTAGIPVASFVNTTNATNTIIRALSISGFTSGTPADGLGLDLNFTSETTGTGGAEGITSNRFVSKFTTVDHPTRTSQVDIMGLDNATEETFMNIQANGVIRVNNNADSLASQAYARSVAAVTLTKGFMADTTSVSGVKTITPRYTFFDDFVGNNNAASGSVFLNKLASGANANAIIYLDPHGITGATGFGYGVLQMGTATTGKAVFQQTNVTNRNSLGLVNNDYYYRLSYKNVIFNDLSDGTETYKTQFGFKIDNAVTNSIVITYTHSENSGAFICTSHNNNTAESTNTAVTVAADTEYDLDVEYYNQTAKFWINGTLVATHTTQVPAAASTMYSHYAGALKSAGTTDRLVFIDAAYLRIVHENDL